MFYINHQNWKQIGSIVCLFYELSMHLIGCQSDAQEWLQEVRQNTDKYQQDQAFQQPSARVTVGDTIYDRCPYEEIRLDYGDIGHQYHIRIGEDKKIVWCVMCFGREAKLQPHLERSMCLSHGLRNELAPILQKKTRDLVCQCHVCDRRIIG